MIRMSNFSAGLHAKKFRVPCMNGVATDQAVPCTGITDLDKAVKMLSGLDLRRILKEKTWSRLIWLTKKMRRALDHVA